MITVSSLFGYVGYECIDLNYKYEGRYAKIIPIDGKSLPYVYVSQRIYFKPNPKFTPETVLDISNIEYVFDPLMLKGKFKISNKYSECNLSVMPEWINTEYVSVSMFVSHKRKKIIFATPPNLPDGVCLKDIIKVKTYIEGIEDFKTENSGNFTIITQMIPDKSFVDCCTLSQLLKTCETPEGNLTIESFNTIKDLLHSSDDESNILGYKLMCTSNMYKYRNSFNRIFITMDWKRSFMTIRTPFFNRQYSSWFSSIEKEDWELLKSILDPKDYSDPKEVCTNELLFIRFDENKNMIIDYD